jgi:hypothetical protein
MRWLILNAVEIGLISLSGVLYLVASEIQVLHTPVRLASLALAIWLVFSVLGDVFQRIPSALKLLAEQQDVKARYLRNIITSIALRCIAIVAFIAVVRVAQ